MKKEARFFMAGFTAMISVVGLQFSCMGAEAFTEHVMDTWIVLPPIVWIVFLALSIAFPFVNFFRKRSVIHTE